MTAEALFLALFARGLRLRAAADGGLIVSPGDRLADDDRAAIRQHRDELLAIVAYLNVPLHAEPRRVGVVHAVPAGCVGPTACAAIGICGRTSCMSPAESDAFALAMATARAATNPHAVPDFYDATAEAA